jgi:hypothetical protein
MHTPETHRRRSAPRRAAWTGALLLPLLALCAAPNAAAQLSGKGQINGTITDVSGAAVPHAQIVITSSQTGAAVTTTSTSSGDFALPTLDPGDYTVSISAQGFQKLTQQNVHVNALETETLNPRLTVGSATEEVTVSAAPPQLETTNATLGATMEQEMYAALPIEMGAYGQPDQRRATDFAFLMPGVQGNNTNGNPTTNAGIVNGSGSRGAVSGIYVDGVVFVRGGGNGDPRYVWTAISVDAVNQFQVQTNGYSAMYEGQGIQNYTIKQGGNKYHGAIYEFFRNTALDTWGYFGANILNPNTGKPQKPVEHSNEFGINLSGPLVPFGSWRDKLFLFGNYNGFRYSSQTPTSITFPTLAQQRGDFSAAGVPIYDPYSQTACTANNGGVPCRYQYGFTHPAGTATSSNNANPGNGTATGPLNVIPASQFSQVALNLQKLVPALDNQSVQNNYNAANSTALNNWSTTERIDWIINPRDTLTLTAAIGRQASSSPVGQATAGRNVGPVPYNYGQAYAPKTAVGIIEETHIFSPHVVNQLKYGFARYNGPTFNADYNPAFGAAGLGGITNLPGGQAANAFPIVTFTGTNAPTNWAGATANVVIAQNFTLVDNVQWQFGKHSLTLGGQLAWLQYLNQPATDGTTPLTLGAAVTQTARINPSNTPNNFAVGSNSGLAYASFLIGQYNSSTVTAYGVQEFASRFRAISPYVQDNWKVNSRLTLDLGVRWDYFPPVREAHDNMSFFNPSLANPVTGQPGALQFAGNGPNTCNCDTPMNTYMKNIGPRLGFAFQSDQNTVWRGSFGIMFTHGNAVGGGGASTLGGSNVSLGFSGTQNTGNNGNQLGQLTFTGNNTAYPTVPSAPGRAAGPAYGTGYATATGYTGTPSTVAYFDPVLGSRAPEYINWSFGFQHQWTTAFTSTISYVGSQGHFLPTDGGNARGYWSDQLDPQFLGLGNNLTLNGSALTSYCATHSGVCPSSLSGFNTGQPLSQLLKPFPFQAVSDITGNVANASYHALQSTFNMRPWHGLTFMANYTWSRSIDNGGTFRTGYAIPAAFSNTGRDWAPDAIERSVSTSNQPQHVVVTGVYDLPFGRTIADSNQWERAILGGFKLSTIYQAYSGSPLAITGATCNTNPAQTTCMPNYNPSFPTSATVRQNGNWGEGITRSTVNNVSYINSNGFSTAPAYTFGNLPRTAAYNLYGPGNYNLDLSIRRSFALHFTESARFNFQADLYNVTNHTQFTVASTAWGNANFGKVSGTQANARRAAQLSARIEF